MAPVHSSRSPRQRFIAVLTLSSLLLAGCGATGTDHRGIGVVGPAALTCDDVTVERPAGRPTNPVGLAAVPSDFGEFPALEVRDPDTEDTFMIPVAGRAGEREAYFVVPVLPSNPVGGGPVTLTLLDGEGESCDPFDFTIEELPAAPGAFAELAAEVQRLRGQTEELFGPLLPASGNDAPEPEALPLEIAEDWLAGEDNANSIERIVAGNADVSDQLTPEAERLMDGLVAESGILDEVAGAAEAVTEIADPPRDVTPGDPPSGDGEGGPAGGPGMCEGLGRRMSAEMLSFLMTGHGKLEAFRDKTDLAITGAGLLNSVVGVLSLLPTAGIPNPVTVASGGIAVTLSAYELLADMTEHFLPSELGLLDFDYDKARYWEDDEDLTGAWENVTVTAHNKEWNLDGRILEIVLKRATGGLSKRFVDRHVADEFTRATATFLHETFISAGTQAAMAHRSEQSGFVNIPACEFGPVDISDPDFHWAEFVPAGDPAVLDGDMAYLIVDTGQGQLVIRARSERFNNSHAMAKEPVIADPIKIRVDPARSHGDPGYTATFTVIVENANDTSIDVSLHPAGGHAVDVEQISDDTYEVRVDTSGQREDFPTLLRVESTSSSGLRALPDAPPRVGTAIIRSGGDVHVGPGAACLEPGETQQYTAVVAGFDNQGVTWEATGGSISPTGRYTAPEAEGQYQIRVTADADRSRSATATVTVADTCQCWAFFESPALGISQTATMGSIAFAEQEAEGELLNVLWELEDGTTLVLSFFGAPLAMMADRSFTTDQHNHPLPHRGPSFGDSGNYLVELRDGFFEPSGNLPEFYYWEPHARPLGGGRWDTSLGHGQPIPGFPANVVMQVEEFTAIDDTTAWLKGSLRGTVIFRDRGDHFIEHSVRMHMQGRFSHDPAEDMFPGIGGTLFDRWRCGA